MALPQQVTGTGADVAPPVMQEVRDEARHREIHLVVLATAQATAALAKTAADPTPSCTCRNGGRYSQHVTDLATQGNRRDVLPRCRFGVGMGLVSASGWPSADCLFWVLLTTVTTLAVRCGIVCPCRSAGLMSATILTNSRPCRGGRT